MIQYEPKYRKWLKAQDVGLNDLIASSPDSYVSYLNSVSNLLGTDISPNTPANLAEKVRGTGEAAKSLQDAIDKHAMDGFEFYRVDTFAMQRPAGCLGGNAEVTGYTVVTFRRPRE